MPTEQLALIPYMGTAIEGSFELKPTSGNVTIKGILELWSNDKRNTCARVAAGPHRSIWAVALGAVNSTQWLNN